MSAAELRSVTGASSPNGTTPIVDTTDTTGRTDRVAGQVGSRAAPPLSRLEWALLVVLSTMLLGVGGLGAFVSFSNVRAAMHHAFGSLAWAVPLGVDIGIALFTGWDLLLSRLDMRSPLLRFVPWSLVAATIYLNVEPSVSAGDLPGAVGHAVLPGIWVISVEIAAGLVRHRAGLARPAEARARLGWLARRRIGRRGQEIERLERVRWGRWVFAPFSTLRIRRLMILWEERSYQAALDRWMARSRARGHMARRYGRIKWRWRAPIDQRLDYRYAQLSLASVVGATTAGPGDGPRPSPGPGSRDPGGGSPHRRQGAASHKRTTPAANGPARDVSQLLPVAREVAAELAERGLKLTRDSLREGFKARGQSLSNADAGPVLRQLREEADR